MLIASSTHLLLLKRSSDPVVKSSHVKGTSDPCVSELAWFQLTSSILSFFEALCLHVLYISSVWTGRAA